jgi:hypothetical protein
MCLACDFTVSGEIPNILAMCLFEQPRLIMTRTSRSRAVRLSLTSGTGGSRRPAARSAFQRGNRLPAEAGNGARADGEGCVAGVKSASFKTELMLCSSRWRPGPPVHRRGNAGHRAGVQHSPCSALRANRGCRSDCTPHLRSRKSGRCRRSRPRARRRDQGGSEAGHLAPVVRWPIVGAVCSAFLFSPTVASCHANGNPPAPGRLNSKCRGKFGVGVQTRRDWCRGFELPVS